MFLIDSALAASDWEGTNQAIKKILEKAKADVVSLKKWDERRLAYNIRGKSRGTYILCYFNTPGSKISQIERDIRLSEKIMRALIIRADHIVQEDIEKETQALTEEKQEEKQPKIESENVNQQQQLESESQPGEKENENKEKPKPE